MINWTKDPDPALPVEKSSKIYVAGHTGLVGSALVRGLKTRGYTNIISRTPAELDLTRQRETEEFFKREKPEYVFLAAAKVGGILANSTYTAEFIYDNIVIAANVINSAYRNNVKKLLNLGSSCIYPRIAAQPMKETSLLTGALEPTNEPYAIAKIAALKLCRYYNEQYGTNFISVMPTNLYGPGDNFNLETAHVLPALIRKFHLAVLLKKRQYDAIRDDISLRSMGFGSDKRILSSSDFEIEKILQDMGIESSRVVIWGDGSGYREFLYIDDLVWACILLMEKHGYKEMGEFINIGFGKDIIIRDLVTLVKGVVGFDGQVVYDASKPSGMPRKLLDISRITALGWKPTIGLEDGIKKEYRWYLQEKK